jgi:hypothetical protein
MSIVMSSRKKISKSFAYCFLYQEPLFNVARLPLSPHLTIVGETLFYREFLPAFRTKREALSQRKLIAVSELIRRTMRFANLPIAMTVQACSIAREVRIIFSCFLSSLFECLHCSCSFSFWICERMAFVHSSFTGRLALYSLIIGKICATSARSDSFSRSVSSL